MDDVKEENKFINPPNITKTRIIRFDNQKNVWVVYVNVKEQYMFGTEGEAIAFLKQAYSCPHIRVIGSYRNKSSLRLGHLYEILNVYDNIVKARSLHSGKIEYLNRKDVKVYPLFLKRVINATVNSIKNFRFNLGDSVAIIKNVFLNGLSYKQKSGIVSDRWINFEKFEPVNYYRVDVEGLNSINVPESFLVKYTIRKKASVKYMDFDSKEVKEISEFGLTDETNLPDEVTKDGKKYKKIVVSD